MKPKSFVSMYVCLPVLTAACSLLLARPVAAQSVPDPNPGSLTVTSSVDLTNVYMFRGIRQDDTKVMIWPAADLGLAVYSGDGALKSAAIDFGSWNSLHTGNAGLKSASKKMWYESDFYTSFSMGFGGGLSLGTTYTAYTSPNAGFTSVKEVMFKLGVDDSAKLGKGALKPYGIVALEFNTEPGVGQADGGLKAGRYLELGVGPGWTGSKASLTFPVKVGLSLANYYEFDGVDNRFGYFSAAGIGSVPLKLPASFGAWNVHAGVEFQQLGTTPQAFNNGEAQKVIVSGGIGLTY
ncbi:MAG TPA: hypothetical protein VN654_23010 [Vicinamibacterales bacterium]|jgi:hypothetical protein|nr:hypothetical protein [Vicinamibacterales bacterium]